VPRITATTCFQWPTYFGKADAQSVEMRRASAADHRHL
jgi:hypothetical protein